MKTPKDAKVGDKFIITHNVPTWGLLNAKGEIAALSTLERRVHQFVITKRPWLELVHPFSLS